MIHKHHSLASGNSNVCPSMRVQRWAAYVKLRNMAAPATRHSAAQDRAAASTVYAVLQAASPLHAVLQAMAHVLGLVQDHVQQH